MGFVYELKWVRNNNKCRIELDDLEIALAFYKILVARDDTIEVVLTALGKGLGDYDANA